MKQHVNLQNLLKIGEHGATLSGGQKTRIAIARAFYSNRDVYLFDDIFASIDRSVADRIFEEGVKDLLVNRTVLLVTSNADVRYNFFNFENFLFLSLWKY